MAIAGPLSVDATQRFTGRAAAYADHRPGYPGEVLDVLRAELGLRPGWVIADVGSGTGIASRLFLDAGHTVYGVEPNADMRSVAEARLAAFESFHSVAGMAESTRLRSRSVDLIVAAQAFHWFDLPAATREFRRILRPGGWVVLLWNTRRSTGRGFPEAYERLLVRHGIDYGRVRHDRDLERRLNRLFSAASGQRAWRMTQRLDLEELKGRLLSTSYVPVPPDPRAKPMLAELEEIFREHEEEGRVLLPYETRMYWGRPAVVAERIPPRT